MIEQILCFLSKLAQYEDSGLTPEQAQKIGKEEK